MIGAIFRAAVWATLSLFCIAAGCTAMRYEGRDGGLPGIGFQIGLACFFLATECIRRGYYGYKL